MCSGGRWRPLSCMPRMHCRAMDAWPQGAAGDGRRFPRKHAKPPLTHASMCCRSTGRELLLDLKRPGLKQDPKLAVGDGALGFWTALQEVFATTREQRCWVHKMMNVLKAMPKSVQAKAKGHLHDIWQAETKAKANVAFDFFIETYGVKWDKAVAKLVKDRDALLTFYDYPAEHWKHIRTSNPIDTKRREG